MTQDWSAVLTQAIESDWKAAVAKTVQVVNTIPNVKARPQAEEYLVSVVEPAFQAIAKELEEKHKRLTTIKSLAWNQRTLVVWFQDALEIAFTICVTEYLGLVSGLLSGDPSLDWTAPVRTMDKQEVSLADVSQEVIMTWFAHVYTDSATMGHIRQHWPEPPTRS